MRNDYFGEEPLVVSTHIPHWPLASDVRAKGRPGICEFELRASVLLTASIYIGAMPATTRTCALIADNQEEVPALGTWGSAI